MSDQSIDLAKEINDVVDRLKPIVAAVADGFQLRDIGVYTENVPLLVNEMIDFFVKAGAEYSEIRENVQELQRIWEQKRSNSG